MFDAEYVIIGGGIAGTAAAETLRKRDTNARIIIVSDEPHRLYSRVLLTKPNFFLGKIPFERIYLKDEKWYEDLKIELWRGRRAVHINTNNHIVDLDNGEQLKYKKLLIAIGGSPRKIDIPGADKKGVYYLRTVDETKNIIESVHHAKKGVAIGGGIIGFEMAEMMALSGMETTFVILKPHYRIGVLGEEASKIVEKSIEKSNIRIMREAKTVEILGDECVSGIRFEDGTELKCDFIVVGIGTVVPGDFLKEAGVKVERGICANSKLETNIPDVYTAGDCAQYKDLIIDEELTLGNWANAQAQGQTAARNMMGDNEDYKYVSFFTTHGFGHAMTYVGDFRQDMEGREVIERGSPHDKGYGRIVCKGDRVVGALFMDSTKSVQHVATLIEKKTDISKLKGQLADPNVDLVSLM